ncbi:transcriptional regulator, TraR/DksA family [Brevibacterium iodinum ATCC 49514]|uniref:Transcriptional regulator, TraR/DksA family n=2 Tax=Brevibacterium TaxID=1696 RepID=A0A2H1HMI1_9MICO|nr:transcriptional regulator, TraR/DksA family [Brevibacterium iodinum ATCC 49514]SUW13294.1 General stress protein 16O [Brevibacterium iodinum]
MIDEATMRQRLEDERAETQALISRLTQGIDEVSAARQGDNSDDEHDPEGATLAFERSQAATLLEQSEDRLEEIAEAVDRLNAGTFGTCIGCGRPIAEARLEARPYAAKCVNCAARDYSFPSLVAHARPASHMTGRPPRRWCDLSPKPAGCGSVSACQHGTIASTAPREY